MSRLISSTIFKYSVPAVGLLAFLLRFLLLRTGVDDQGLLVTGHWADTASWLLTAAVIGAVILFTRKSAGPEACDEASAPSALRCAGSLVAACGFLLSGTPAVTSLQLSVAEPVLRVLAAVALAAVGYCRLRGKKPPFLLHGTACLYLALRMLCWYQLWSADPQLQHYAFYLGAHVALMLSCYQLTALDAGSGSCRSLWRWGLGGVYLCLAALPGSEDPFFLLCCAVWLLTCLGRPAPSKGD